VLAAAIVSIILVALTVVIHYEILRLTSDALPRLAILPRLRIIIVIGWTASFTFLAMQRFWSLHGTARNIILSRQPG